jgi:hypothetical protein
MDTSSNEFPSQVSEECPYSSPPFLEFTGDHIFPECLGGRRTIRVCRNCNSRFGHLFEAKAAMQLKRMQVFVSHFGLDLSRTPASWPSALEIDGVTYDLKSGPSGVQYELARPVILRNEAGQIIGGRARSLAEAKQIADSLKRKGLAKDVNVEKTPSENLNGIKLEVDLSYNQELYKFSTKLASNLTIAMGREALIKASGIANYLHGASPWNARLAYCDTSAIRDLRPQLSHTAYVEFGLQSHAVIILFGGPQIYVPLPTAKKGAILAFLDPITGEEWFGEVAPLGIPPAPSTFTEGEAKVHFKYILERLAEEGIARGAKYPPNLSVSAYDLGSPSGTS